MSETPCSTDLAPLSTEFALVAAAGRAERARNGAGAWRSWGHR
ncbi:hypothetical protein [Halorubrum sp. Atlit-26R]|nr:hypothetical protein [Halorubrum sp. Atlit-26R]